MNRKFWRICIWGLILLLAACISQPAGVGEYALIVGAGRGKFLLAHRVIYVVNEYGTILNLDVPKDLGNNPEWSPDGQWITYSQVIPNAKSVSDRDIFVLNLATSTNPIRVTENPGPDDMPVWSPDGTKIAFYAYVPNILTNGIFLLDVECIVRGKACLPKQKFLISGVDPAWSPNGKNLVYRDETNYDIYIVDIQNPVNVVEISQGLGPCVSPRWSPHGDQIAFICNETMYSVEPDGKNLTKLISGALYLRWSPDGEKITFIGTEKLDSHLGQSLDLEGMVSSTAIFIMDANGTNLRRVTKSNEESIGWFTWLLASSFPNRR